MKMIKAKPAITGVAVTISQAVFQFLVLSVLAMQFGIESVGNFSFINAILIVVFMLFSLGLRQAYVLENTKYGYKTFYYLRILCLLLGALTSLIIILYIDANLVLLLVPLCIYRVTELLSELQWADYQANKKFNLILYSQAGRYTVTSLMFILLSYTTQDLYITLWGYALSGLLYVIMMDGKNIFINIKSDESPLNLLECFKEFAPLSLSLTSMSIQNNGVRFFLGIFGGEYLLGLFTIAYQLFNMPYMIFMAGLNFYLKKSSKSDQNKNITLKNLYLVSFIFTAICVLGWYVFGDLITQLFFGNDYQVIVMPILILLVFTFFRYIAFCHQWRMMNNGKYNHIAKHQLILSIIISVTSFILVYFYQYNGAYFALGASCIMYYLYFFILDTNENK
jgi:O-antigen/teichoic acid export membrane protein